MVKVPLVAQQQGGVVRRQFQLAQLVQQRVGVVEAVHVTDTVHHHEGLSPAQVVVQAPCRLKQLKQPFYHRIG